MCRSNLVRLRVQLVDAPKDEVIRMLSDTQVELERYQALYSSLQNNKNNKGNYVIGKKGTGLSSS